MDTDAQILLRQAFERAYTWPAGFAGFAADVAVNFNGATHRGTLTATGPRQVAVAGIADEAVKAFVEEEVGTICAGRAAVPFEERHGGAGVTAAAEDGHPLGRVFQVADGTRYRLHDGRITQILRHSGNVAVRITVLEHFATPDGRELFAQFVVAFQHPQSGKLLGINVYRDRACEVGGVWLPAARTVVVVRDGDELVRELRWSGHQLA